VAWGFAERPSWVKAMRQKLDARRAQAASPSLADRFPASLERTGQGRVPAGRSRSRAAIYSEVAGGGGDWFEAVRLLLSGSGETPYRTVSLPAAARRSGAQQRADVIGPRTAACTFAETIVEVPYSPLR